MNYTELVALIQETTPGAQPLPKELKKLAVYKGFKSELDKLKQLIHEHTDEAALCDTLKTFLVDYWHNYKKEVLSYTCIPKHPLTHLCINIAVFISKHTKENPLALLMPDLNLIPYDEDRPDFPRLDIVPENQVEWLRTLLATHIISDDAVSLIPIKILNTLTSDNKSQQELRIPYELEHQGATYYVSPQAYLRLSNHSDYTRAVTNTKKQIDIMDKEDNLLSQLLHLTKLLGSYSAHGGTGTQEDAAAAAYDAIYLFNEYYNKLTIEQKELIPEDVKQEIELLLALSSQSEQNIEATGQLETCIGTRKEKLDAAIIPNQSILSQISLSAEEQSSFTVDTLKAFENAKEALTHALEQKQYHQATEAIQDGLLLTMRLIDKLGIRVTFDLDAGLELFASLDPEEITDVLKGPDVKNRVIHYFLCHPNVRIRTDQLFILFVSLTPERIIAFLSETASDLVKKKILFNKWQLIQILASSLPDKCRAICIGLREQIPLLIPDLITFQTMVSYLNKAQFLEVYAALGDHFVTLIQTPEELRGFLNFMPDDKLDTYLDSSKESIIRLIPNMGKLKTALRFVFDEKAVKLIATLKSKLPGFIQDANDFRYVFYYLQDPNNTGSLLEVGTEIYQQLSPESISRLIHEFDDIQHILMFLDSAKRIEIYNQNKNKIHELTNTIYDIKQLFDLLEPAQRQEAFEGLKNKIPHQIKKLEDFLACFSCLTVEEFEDISAHLPIDRLIKTDKDIQYLINEADDSTSARICFLLRKQIGNLISDRNLSGFNESKRAQIQSCFRGLLPIQPIGTEAKTGEEVKKETKPELETESNLPDQDKDKVKSSQNKATHVNHQITFAILATLLTASVALIILASILLVLNIGLLQGYLFLAAGLAVGLLSIFGLSTMNNKPEPKPDSTANNRYILMPTPPPKETESFYGGPLDSLLFGVYG